jgi:hypothetical protein
MAGPRARRVPRPFAMPWGAGQIVEEASFSGEWHEPTLQLLEYTDGDARGSVSVRFCYYGHDGRFQRGPLMIGEDDLDGLREALEAAPRLKGLLRRLVAEASPDAPSPARGPRGTRDRS